MRFNRLGWLLYWVCFLFVSSSSISLVWLGALGTFSQRVLWTVGLTLLTVFGAVWLIAYLTRTRIKADREGISWRSLFRERRVLWSEVKAYYSVTTKDSKSYVIETSEGKVSVDSMMTRNAGLLREVVAERAQWASTREWAAKGVALAAGEVRTFVIDTSIFQVMYFIGGCLAFVVLITIATCLGGSLCNPLSTGCVPGPAPTFNPKPLVVFLAYAPVLVLVLPLFWRQVKYARNHARERVTVDEDEIIWSDGGPEVRMQWVNIESVKVEAEKAWVQVFSDLVIEGRGSRISVRTSAFKDGRNLRAMVERYAPARAARSETGANVQKHEVLPDGSLRFGYRNRTARAMLWFVSAHLGLVPLVAGLRISGVVPQPAGNSASADWSFGAFGLVLLTFVAYGWWCYYRSSLVIGPTHLEHHGAFGVRRVALGELVAVSFSAYVLRIEGKGQTLWVGSFLSDVAGLQRELGVRVPGGGEGVRGTR